MGPVNDPLLNGPGASCKNKAKNNHPRECTEKIGDTQGSHGSLDMNSHTFPLGGRALGPLIRFPPLAPQWSPGLFEGSRA